ncbi:DUF3365 domain-containing protein [Burkholderia sp. Tr-862]|uniref:DUF3365 domain-containing protein n=1 Tax=Burkholderia sp. Tr-862 TaxID=2608331 RepID=UPI00141A14CC|nr:DUF3365 domain-containing protein [Burkholderia sp. Tr-862]NIF40126.1 DUF3365 domain-containing protein [Burkholderia sp. Tr-862]
MKKQFLLAALAVACNSTFASQTAEQAAIDAAQGLAQAQLAIRQPVAGKLDTHQPSQDPFSFCYFKNDAYSLGAVRDGFVCEDTGVHMRTSDGAIDRDRSDPLRWIPVSPKAHRSNG